MGNSITNIQADDQSINMSNTLTDIFIFTLAMAASHLAISEEDKNLAIWLAERDSSIAGRGAIGFDLNNIPWKHEICDQQKQFLIESIKSASQKLNWDLLPSTPSDLLLNCYTQFSVMIQKFDKRYIVLDQQIPISDFDFDTAKFDFCQQHQCYKHSYGCVVCNNS